MKISIKKLYGKKDISVDFKNKINILIGENGSGKSTIMKIIYYLSQKNFINLLKINFEEIEVEVDGKYEVIKYSDIIPMKNSNKYGFSIFIKKLLREFNFKKINLESINYKDDLKKEFEEFYLYTLARIKELDDLGDREDNILYDLDKYVEEDISLYFDKKMLENYSTNPYRLIELKECFYNIFSEEKAPYGSKLYLYNRYIFEKICLTSGFSYEKIIRLITEKKFIELKRYKENVNKIIDKFSEQTYVKDKVSDKIITRIPKVKNQFYNDVINQFKEFGNLEKVNRRRKMFDNLSNFSIFETSIYDNYVSFHSNFSYKKCMFDSNTIRKIVGNCNDLLMKFSRLESDITVSKFFNDKVIRILSIINSHISNSFFSPLHVDTSNQWGDTSMHINNYKTYLDKKFSIYDNIEQQQKNYIYKENPRPFDVLYNLIKISFEYKKDKSENKLVKDICDTPTSFPYNFDLLFNYLNSDEIINQITEESYRVFHSLIKKYLPKKNIECYFNEEKELELCVVEEKVKEKTKECELSSKEKFSLELMMSLGIEKEKSKKILSEGNLSSGEQKILRIIKAISFSDKKTIVLFDEPELSLSLYWKQMLIDDIMKYCKSEMIIIATQSPSLIKEEHMNYLIEFLKE